MSKPSPSFPPQHPSASDDRPPLLHKAPLPGVHVMGDDTVTPDGQEHRMLPAHLYGTRAALFYLLREAAPPMFAPMLPSAPVAAAIAPVGGPVMLQLVPPALPPAPAGHGPDVQPTPDPADRRTALGDMLLSDNFDFRSPGGGN